jgi:GNAT superfamily N-acetyltransferase
MVGHNVGSTPRASNQKDGLPRRFTDDLLGQADPPVHLCVAQDYRGRGIGGRLLHLCAQAAKEAGAVWLEWQTPRWNMDAIDFYLHKGARKRVKERIRFVL